jgi:tripartite-type tricarboxylate transporter receptor subunit TctC
LTAVLEVPEVRAKLEAQGLDVVGSTPDEFADVLKKNQDKWSALVDDLGIRAN